MILPKHCGHFYEFGGFRFYPDERLLRRIRDGHPFALLPKASSLLLALIRRNGNLATYDELRVEVWPEKPSVSIHTIQETKRTLSKILNESADIIETATGKGYRLTVAITERGDDATYNETSRVQSDTVPEMALLDCEEAREDSQEIEIARAQSRWRALWDSMGHPRHVIASCALYALLYTMALLIEVAYQFDRLGSTALAISPLVFIWVFGTSVVGMAVGRKVTLQGKAGLIFSLSVFIIAGLMLYAAVGLFLPASPVTEAQFQTYTAHGAYLKSVYYFLPLAVVFLVIPFHFVVSTRRESEEGDSRPVLDLLTGGRWGAAPEGSIYIRVWWLGLLLFGALIFSLAATSHLFENLKPGAYMNLFMQLVQFRLVLYFALGLECLFWYQWSLNEIKREHLGADFAVNSTAGT